MYEAFFDLRTKPFDLLPDPRFLYLSSSHKKALTYLDYGIRERVGFILLTGEVGSGKTTLIRNLIQRKYDRVVLAKVFNTKVNSEQLLSMINDDFGLNAAGKDKVVLMRELNEFLVQQFAAGNQPLLIIDEAQNLAAEQLEEVRMLSNLESSRHKLLQIVLVGQPELRDTLDTPELLQLRQRISITCHLKALTREELERYIEHRLEVAGNAGALPFSRGVLDLLHAYSRGIPRLINIFCDFILLSAFAEECRTVTEAMVQDVLDELDFERHFWGAPARVQSTGGEPTVNDPCGPAAASDAQLTEISCRVAALEKNLNQQVPAALKRVCDSLGALKDDLLEQDHRQEAWGEQLKQQVETLSRAVAALEQPRAVRSPAPSTGFMRGIWEGICGYSGKK